MILITNFFWSSNDSSWGLWVDIREWKTIWSESWKKSDTVELELVNLPTINTNQKRSFQMQTTQKLSGSWHKNRNGDDPYHLSYPGNKKYSKKI